MVACATHTQVLLRWGLEAGAGVLPMSAQRERICQHAPAQLLSWRLPQEAAELLL